jgi:hypothetical protein
VERIIPDIRQRAEIAMVCSPVVVLLMLLVQTVLLNAVSCCHYRTMTDSRDAMACLRPALH